MSSSVMDHTLREGPEAYWTPEDRPTLAEANAWCKALTGSHYENFHVATFFLPKKVRRHFESIYAYCRVADDLGDEVADTATASRLLTAFGAMLNECYDQPERSMHPVFVALRETVVACDLPRDLFLDLLVAFQMDQVKTKYETMGELMEYSRYSANPVGRLVLMVCGYRDERLALLSDKVCTALQLANFWQDVVEDAERGRRYLPGEAMEAFGVEEGQILGRVFTPSFQRMMESLCFETRAMLTEGGAISQGVDGELRVTLDLFRKGGEAILDGIAAQHYDVLRGRPVVTKAKKAMLLVGALWAKLLAGGQEVTVEAAYAACRVIAKREAKNFYYSFRVLPQAKSDAMCAVYAFMRKADDLSDDESISVEARRVAMAEWLGAWRAARAGGATEDPVFVALGDAQRRFGISDELLEDLVRGTTLDLEAVQAGVATVTVEKATDEGRESTSYQVYETFDGLYRYCYLVASVVGLVCIKVFGYTDPAAEKLAEETGIAFQLTNILRDVKEDVERGRVYLPLDDMRATGADVEQIVIATEQGIVGHGVRILTVKEGKRAKAYYASAEKLLPMIDADSRAALWVMVTIYRKVLEKIAAKGYPLSERVALSTVEKMWVLARGAMMARKLKAAAR